MDVMMGINIKMDNGELEALIEQYKYGRYCEDPCLPLEGSRRFVFNHVRQYLSHDESKCVAAFSSTGQILGLLIFKLSQWDTEHFGYNVVVINSVITRELDYDQKLEIASALLEQFHIWCQAAYVRFVSVRVPALDLPVVHSLERWGFRYIESWIYNKYDLNKVDRFGKTPYELRLAQPDDCGVMLDYSGGAFSTQRFHADPHIVRHKADSLYEKWILTAFKDPSQHILVLDIENRPVAFMIYYKNDLRQYFGLQFAMWKMALLDPGSRGRGWGTEFFIALIHYHRRDGLDVVDSGLSMRNLVSLDLHNKLHFKVISTVVTFHKWLE
jgi:GNAT superfamily N-acetyltransferase